MEKLFENNFAILLISILAMLFLGRLLGELAKKFGFPEITGELLAGVFLGPFILGKLNFNLYEALFFKSSKISQTLECFLQMSLILIMFNSGLKIDFSSIIKHKQSTLLITFFGTLIPFCAGSSMALWIPDFFLVSPHSDFVFPAFVGMAFAIAALPVIAKILIDTQLIHTSLGTIVISSAILTDIIGWVFFAFITQSKENLSILSIILIIGFFIYMMVFGNKLIGRFLQKIEKTSHWPYSAITLSLCICLFFSILSQSLSLHSCLGAFMAGIMLKESLKNYPQIKETINQFIMSFFSPLFFVSIGLKINFVEEFNLVLIIAIFVFASFSKIISVLIGAYFSGIKGTKAFIISLALNARGAMEIVFSTVALELGIISDPIYVALVVMALLTSMISGILIGKITKRHSKLEIGIQQEVVHGNYR